MLFETTHNHESSAIKTMSTWRRRATQLLPEQRQYVQSARSPLVLWQHLYTFAVDACRRGAVGDDLLRRLFAYARESRSNPASTVGIFVCSEFYEKLFDDEVARTHFQRHLSETEFLEFEPILARRFTPKEFQGLRETFYAVRQEMDSGTTLGAVRQLKDELLSGAASECAHDVYRAWSMALPLLEVHEYLVGLEIFIDNVSCLEPPIRSDLESQLLDLLKSTGAQGLAGKGGDA